MERQSRTSGRGIRISWHLAAGAAMGLMIGPMLVPDVVVGGLAGAVIGLIIGAVVDMQSRNDRGSNQ